MASTIPVHREGGGKLGPLGSLGQWELGGDVHDGEKGPEVLRVFVRGTLPPLIKIIVDNISNA
jgi:hypothetical protein